MSERPPMTPGTVVAAAMTIYRERWRDLAMATVVCVIPVVVFGLLIISTLAPQGVLEALGGTLSPEQSETALLGLTADERVTVLVLSALFGAISGCAQTLAFGSCIVIVLGHRAGETPSYRSAIRTGLGMFPSLLWVTFLTLLVTLVGLALFIVPGIWLFVALALAPIVLFVEDRRGYRAGLRSIELVRGQWWTVFLVGAVVIVGFLLLELVVGAIFGAILSPITRDNPFGSFFASGLVSSSIWLIANGVHAAVVTVLFFDLRARKYPEDQAIADTT